MSAKPGYSGYKYDAFTDFLDSKVQPFSEIQCLDLKRVTEFLFGVAFLFTSKTLTRYRGQKPG